MTNSNSNSKTKKEAQDALDRFKMEVAPLASESNTDVTILPS